MQNYRAGQTHIRDPLLGSSGGLRYCAGFSRRGHWTLLRAACPVLVVEVRRGLGGSLGGNKPPRGYPFDVFMLKRLLPFTSRNHTSVILKRDPYGKMRGSL